MPDSQTFLFELGRLVSLCSRYNIYSQGQIYIIYLKIPNKNSLICSIGWVIYCNTAGCV